MPLTCWPVSATTPARSAGLTASGSSSAGQVGHPGGEAGPAGISRQSEGTHRRSGWGDGEMRLQRLIADTSGAAGPDRGREWPWPTRDTL